MNSKGITLKVLIDKFETYYPDSYAETWDQVGLHFGSINKSVHKIMTSLDINNNVINEAIENSVDTIIVHHPPLFNPIKRFNLDLNENKVYESIIKNNINVFALHTNYDVADNGMNDCLSKKLKLHDIKYINSDTMPSLGRIGTLPQKLPREELIEFVKEIFNLQYLNIVETKPKEFYQSIAIVGGSGMDLLEEISMAKPDVFITGDITYHKAQNAENYDFMTIDAGHYIESIFNYQMEVLIKEWIKDYNWDIEVISSKTNTNPFKVE